MHAHARRRWSWSLAVSVCDAAHLLHYKYYYTHAHTSSQAVELEALLSPFATLPTYCITHTIPSAHAYTRSQAAELEALLSPFATLRATSRLWWRTPPPPILTLRYSPTIILHYTMLYYAIRYHTILCYHHTTVLHPDPPTSLNPACARVTSRRWWRTRCSSPRPSPRRWANRASAHRR